MPRPEHCPWNLYCVIKECWSYQVIFGVIRWLFVCLSDSSTYSKHVNIQINLFSQRQGRPGKPLWRRLEASTTRWQSLENIITSIIVIIVIIVITIIIIVIIIIITKVKPGTYLELLSAASHPTPTSSPENSGVRLKKQVSTMHMMKVSFKRKNNLYD